MAFTNYIYNQGHLNFCKNIQYPNSAPYCVAHQTDCKKHPIIFNKGNFCPLCARYNRTEEKRSLRFHLNSSEGFVDSNPAGLPARSEDLRKSLWSKAEEEDESDDESEDEQDSVCAEESGRED